MTKKIYFLFLLLFVSSLARDYTYKSMDLKVSVQPDSTTLVNETWSMAFQGHFSEGYRYFYADRIRISDFRVFSRGVELSSQQVSGGTKPEFTWSIDVTDSDEIYLMQYKIEKAFQPKDDYDLLYYTIVFADREKPVEHVSFEITFPKDINLNQISHRSTHGTLQQTGPSTLYLEYNNLPSDTALDLEIQLPKGIVEIPFDWLGFLIEGFIILSVAGGFLSVLVLTPKSLLHIYSEWEKYGKDPEVVHKSEMLANLKPAIAGLIVDEKAGINEIIATIIDLAIRGYIRIRQTDSFFGLVKDQELTRLKDDHSSLEEYESQMMKDLFDGSDKVTTSELRNKFYTNIPTLTTIMNKAALQAGLFDGDPEEVIRRYTGDFIKWPAISLILLIFIFLSNFFIGMFGVSIGSLDPIFISITFTLIPLFFVVALLLIVAGVAAYYMPRKSSKGVEMKNKYEELKGWM